jgi:hypothetical protein
VRRALPLPGAILDSAADHMLENPCIRLVLIHVTAPSQDGVMGSENPSGADNQQERPGIEEWIVGFVDGEGCFSIAIVRNPTMKSGWQVQHEFAVVQGFRSKDVLEDLIRVFGCGKVIEQKHDSSHREPLCRFSVKRRWDLVERIVPFFEEHPLRTAKQLDFERFRTVLQLMQHGRHLEESGLREIARITEAMNRRQRSRYLESSETIRRPTRTTSS